MLGVVWRGNECIFDFSMGFSLLSHGFSEHGRVPFKEYQVAFGVIDAQVWRIGNEFYSWRSSCIFCSGHGSGLRTQAGHGHKGSSIIVFVSATFSCTLMSPVQSHFSIGGWQNIVSHFCAISTKNISRYRRRWWNL